MLPEEIEAMMKFQRYKKAEMMKAWNQGKIHHCFWNCFIIMLCDGSIDKVQNSEDVLIMFMHGVSDLTKLHALNKTI